MTIVAFLQNQWFRDPNRAHKLLALYEVEDPDGRETFIADMLFLGCLTGRRLRQVFGKSLCGRIVWENVSREIGGRASSAFPADPGHIRAVLAKHRPAVVLAFGRVATDAVAGVGADCPVISGPHPAARGSEVLGNLAQMRRDLEAFLEKSDGPGIIPG